jgi:hypothetical protein
MLLMVYYIDGQRNLAIETTNSLYLILLTEKQLYHEK